MNKHFELKGVLPAIVLPLNPDFSIAEAGLRRHVRRVLGVPGVNGIVCNAHASEVTLLTRAEKKKVLEIVCQEVNGRVPVIAGVYGEGTELVKEAALDAKTWGADALLIAPPFSFFWGATQYPEVPFEYFSAIDKAVDLPFIVFQYAHWTNCSYDCQTLAKLAGIKNFIAIKNAVNDPLRYEEQYRCLKAVRPDISVLNAADVQLLAYFCIGADGALVGYASLVPELFVGMHEAMEHGDLKTAREISDRMFPLTQAIYSHPRLNWHTRIKEALVMTGEIQSAAAKPFLPALSSAERESIRQAMISSGVLTS